MTTGYRRSRVSCARGAKTLLPSHINGWTEPRAMRSSDLHAGGISPVIVQVGVEEADHEPTANVVADKGK